MFLLQVLQVSDPVLKWSFGGLLLVLAAKEIVVPLLLRRRNGKLNHKHLAAGLCPIGTPYADSMKADLQTIASGVAHLVKEHSPNERGVQTWKNPGLAEAIEKLTATIRLVHEEVRDVRRENQAGRQGTIERRKR